MAGSMITNPFAVPQSYADSSVVELKALCKERKLRTTGKKAGLILSLEKYETQARVLRRATTSESHQRSPISRIKYWTNPSSAGIIALLESEDKARTFHRLLDLPPELRNSVYRFATVSGTVTALVRPPPPPICQASKQLRCESLPIFFGLTNFGLTINGSVVQLKPQKRTRVLREAQLDRAGCALAEGSRCEKAKFLRPFTINVMAAMMPYECSLTSIRFAQGMQGVEFEGLGVWTVRQLLNLVPSCAEDDREVVLPEGLENILRGVCKTGMNVQAVAEMVACFCQSS